jgi:SpoVK/Ycf46/Vps4 family AAA+-type ATPase
MMSQGTETVRKLLVAHFEGDEAGFRSAAWDVVKQERQLNHTILANDLERILNQANGSPKAAKTFFTTLSTSNGNLPKDKDKNACLVEVTDPDRELDDLVLSPPLRAGIDRVLRERRSGELLRSHGVRPVQKLLFCGPPGCGKTVAAEAIAHALYLPLATVRFDAVVSSYLGETAANLRKVFDFARIRPVLLFFDEFDAIGKHRTAADEHGELKRVVNSFLQLLDGFHSETLTVAATNHQGLLDPALWRRFDDILLFPNPTAGEIETLLSRHFRQFTVADSVNLRSVAKGLVGFSQADVERIAQESIKETILSEAKQVSASTLKSAVERQRHRRAITTLENSVTSPVQNPARKRTIRNFR